MKIAFASEYFLPHDLGGSEWSAYYLAKELIKKGHEVIVITPNYGAKSEEYLDNIKIIRFPFYKKIKSNLPISPYWHTGLPWLIMSTFYLIKICRKESIDIIHVQGKYFSPAALVTKLILSIPAIITIRDYQLLCNYGFCIWKKKKACNIFEYFTQDFSFYKKYYLINSSFSTIVINIIFAINARSTKYFYSYFAKRLDKVICISKSQAEIYKKNGFKEVNVIYNTMDFLKNTLKVSPKKQILYAGRLTPGKGVNLFFQSLPKVIKKYDDLEIIVAGEGILKEKLISFAKKHNFIKKVIFLNHINHNKLLKIYSQSLLTVVPSLWPEPFGRAVLESISRGTPAVATNRGGLKEIVEDHVTGYITKAESGSLTKAIIKGINNNNLLRSNIRKNFLVIKNKFQKENVKQYIKIYKSLE